MKELSVAIEAALAGGEVLMSFYGGPLEISFKGDVNLVTEADLRSERTVIELLRRRIPEVSILAEETGESEGDVDRRFIIDPLDGTTNFAHGYPMFAVSIGYEAEGEMQAGVVYDPVREELFTSERGGGAFLNGGPIQVSRTESLEHALLVTGFPYDLRDDLEGAMRLFKRFMSRSRAIRRDGSAALDLCFLACGRFDGFWEEKLGPWDTAAGALIVEEAGGRVTDFEGNRFHCSGKQIIAGNPALHPELLEIVA